MDLATVKKYYEARPFQGFGFELSDGTILAVLNPWNLAFVPDGETLQVVLPDDDWTLVKLGQITRIVPLSKGQLPASRAS